MIYLELFLGFLRVGLFSFGGAYGAIPLIRDVVLSYGWLSDEALAYMIAVSESTPGPIMVNLATYVGSTQAGILGAALATLAVILPAFIIIILLTAVLNTVLKNEYVRAALNGLNPCMLGIILATGAYMILCNCFPVFCASLSSGAGLAGAAGAAGAAGIDLTAVAITAILLLLVFASKPLLKRKLSPITVILIAAGLGMLLY